MQADAFLFQRLVEPGDVVVVEAPTYDRTLLSLRELGAELLAIPLEADGIDVKALELALEEGASPTLAHIIPNFQNPAGCTLSLEKRRRLLELAAEYDFTIFEDDPYVELRFEGESLPTMLSMDESDTVVYASSFSKTVCPGIRVGYLVGPADVIASIRRTATNTYISPNMVAQSIVAEFCHSGAIERSIETVKAALRERRRRHGRGARARTCPDARFVTPEGGYFLWVDLPEGSDVARLERGARERGVIFVKGTDFLIKGGENSSASPTPPFPPTRSRRASPAWPTPTASWPARPRDSASAPAASRCRRALPRLPEGLRAPCLAVHPAVRRRRDPGGADRRGNRPRDAHKLLRRVAARSPSPPCRRSSASSW